MNRYKDIFCTALLACVLMILLTFTSFSLAVAAPSSNVLVVRNTNDSGNGSLRQAILDSNASAGVLNTIVFNVPGHGLKTIYIGTS